MHACAGMSMYACVQGASDDDSSNGGSNRVTIAHAFNACTFDTRTFNCNTYDTANSDADSAADDVSGTDDGIQICCQKYL